MSRKQGTFLNECRKFFPTCTLEEAERLAWCVTAFPFTSDMNLIRTQLKEASQKNNRNAHDAVVWAHEEIFRQNREFLESLRKKNVYSDL